ncbi:phosphatase PAP2 family protein [Streptomyces minutiscleroticus]|uniref:Phosphatase PAP2 family protein n=1 Tax=Streptomyces minutiscleroticus TaxID=68238 RepID=A0A918NKW0_9ACTN|nr:phosphatase PAP2 family protein [Streptomyces minutiscleroticus]GGX77336.1 phosphatase PAP2 family protein [Streptomyces minutiscleroticus]
MHSSRVDAPPLGRRPGPGTAVRASAALGACSLLLLVLVVLPWEPLIALDGDIARTTHRWAVEESGVTQVFRVLTDWVWDPWTMRALCAVAAVWLVWRHTAWWLALWVAATCLLGSALQQVLKAAVGRERPVWPDPVDSAHFAAFPSGHAMTAALAGGLLVWIVRLHSSVRALRAAVRVLAVVSALGVGLTRVWLGVHWPTDVLGGWLLGGLMVALAVLTYHRWGPSRPSAAQG